MTALHSMLKTARRVREEQSGFTLVELIIYTVLAVAITLIVGAIFVSALNGQRDITASAQGNNSGQLVSQSISTGVRSATYIRLSTISATSQMLVVGLPSRTATSSTATVTCKAWYITSDGGGAVYTLTSNSTIIVPTLTLLTSSWTQLATGVQKSTRTGAPSAFLTTNSILVPTSVSYEFAMADGTGKPILISSTATSRQPIALLGSTLCI
jgi:type II secretory pathway pseudopilin PulG